MKPILIVANWKSNKTTSQVNEWFAQISNSKFLISNEKEIIICPSFTLLPILKSSIINHTSSVKLGAQDISPFGEGAFTGEVNGKQIKEYADYVLIGHSERRNNFFEDYDMVAKKIHQAKEQEIIPILCVQDEKTPVPHGVEIVAYEPIFAIGTGSSDTPENAEEVARSIKAANSVQSVLYGGSVDSLNVKTFTQMPSIDGVLVGSASLDPSEFLSIIDHA